MADSDGNSYGGIGLFLTPRNMAKLGQLYLDKGLWKGKPIIGTQVIRNQWIVAASKDQIDGISNGGWFPNGIYSGYGYQWWVSEDLNSYTALGYQGQLIFVHPPKDLVIVLTAEASFATDYIIEDIIDAVLPEIDLSWLAFIIMPSLVLILFLFRKRINGVKVLT
jgi:CubicO group peptidase (beta-lactamase class C family)